VPAARGGPLASEARKTRPSLLSPRGLLAFCPRVTGLDVKAMLQLMVGLLLAVVVLATLARRLKVPYPILLVLGGVALALVPEVPQVQLNPDLVLLLFLPPLLYAAATDMSWRDFRRHKRAIGQLAILLVLVTMLAVAFTLHALVPGTPWPVAFVLGAVLSPTDAVAASAIASRLGLPRPIIAIIEGESLVNDASALVAYRLAVVAVTTGTFSFGRAGLSFLVVAIAGVAVGLAGGWLIAQVSKRIRDPFILILFSLVSPYLVWLPAEALHVSGVLAAVTAGLYVGYHAPLSLKAEARIPLYAVWDTWVLLLNGLAFILLGLQLDSVLSGLTGSRVLSLMGLGLLISLVVMVVRIVWVFPAAYLPRVLIPAIGRADPMPPPSALFVIGWSGMRGVVSLATALALPLTTQNGAPFPYRGQLIFLAFVVVLVTLVVEGLTLGPLIRAFGLNGDGGDVAKEEQAARLAVVKAGQARVRSLLSEPWLPKARAEALVTSLEERRLRLESKVAKGGEAEKGTGIGYRRLMHELIDAQRKELVRLRDEGLIGDEVLHRIEFQLDVEEARVS
jgi:Na+/H+ antiporter